MSKDALDSSGVALRDRANAWLREWGVQSEDEQRADPGLGALLEELLATIRREEQDAIRKFFGEDAGIDFDAYIAWLRGEGDRPLGDCCRQTLQECWQVANNALGEAVGQHNVEAITSLEDVMDRIKRLSPTEFTSDGEKA